jgi:prepilin-type N-terminal cleavage/methylation domain-containing protein
LDINGYILQKKSAFSLLELIAAISILLILAALTNSVWQSFAPKIARAKCLSNMRSLHVSLSSYVTDVGHWPQIPPAVDDAGNEAYEAWWMAELEPFGATDAVWLCPVLKSKRVKDADGYELKMHYVPADFDANPISPRRWPNMPWLIERGNNHGRGSLVAFPDGSIRDSL